MKARYLIRKLTPDCSEIIESSTGVRIHLGSDCLIYAERFGLNYTLL